MSLETGEKLSEVSRRERAIRTIIYIEGLERKGILGAHSLISGIDANNPDGSLLQEIDKAVIHTEPEPEPTFAQRNRIITRRQSRRTVAVLMQRANHPARKYR